MELRVGMLSMNETDRAVVLGQVAERRLRHRKAAEWLGLSVRQVKKLLARYRERGYLGLVLGRRGKPPPNKWVYIGADGIYSGLRGDDGRLCCLVIIGVNRRGQKHFLSFEDGVRASKQSWREVLLSLPQRGQKRPPKLAVGDGELGFWAALEEVYPASWIQRCWMHKTGNVLNYLPKSGQEKAEQGLHDIWMAEGRAEAERRALDHFEQRFNAKYPKAVDCLSKDRDAMLTLYDFPAEHWTHIRTTNIIESSLPRSGTGPGRQRDVSPRTRC